MAKSPKPLRGEWQIEMVIYLWAYHHEVRLMGKTPKPLRILITDPAMLEWDEVKKMVEQGHEIHEAPLPVLRGQWDLVIGPECWRMTNDLRPHWAEMVKRVREWVYPKGSKKGAE